jgi:hypothetical protein
MSSCASTGTGGKGSFKWRRKIVKTGLDHVQLDFNPLQDAQNGYLYGDRGIK